MDNDQLREQVTSEIKETYLDFNSPDFHWVKRNYLLEPYKDTISKIKEFGFDVIEDTDLNEDVSIKLLVRKNHTDCIIRLSLIGKYAIIFQINPEYGDKLVSETDIMKSPILKLLLEILYSESINIIDRQIAETPIQLRLFNTETDKTVIYNALFTDEPFPENIDSQ